MLHEQQMAERTQDNSRYSRPLIDATRNGKVGLIRASRDLVPDQFHEAARSIEVSAIAWLRDDHGQNRGPDSWASARPILSWAKRAIIFTDRAAIEPYRLAVRYAGECWRVALIESERRNLAAWWEAARSVGADITSDPVRWIGWHNVPEGCRPRPD